MPRDWDSHYSHVIVCTTIENQMTADYRLPIFQELPIKHKCITAQPLIEKIHIENYLQGIELVVVGGESDPRKCAPEKLKTLLRFKVEKSQ